uniref:Flavin-containing monooxygenase n=1 Tax=Photinus pyralis TaxID=7054 RepID=A0A1Y1LIS3_PHOPY
MGKADKVNGNAGALSGSCLYVLKGITHGHVASRALVNISRLVATQIVLDLRPHYTLTHLLDVQAMDRQVDALIVGAGFSGIYQLYRLREMGLSVKVIDMAGDVGGTWYWNRYPGAMSDTESFVYRYSWDREDLQTYPWSHRYLKQPEILAYLAHIVRKYDLRKDMQFNTELLSADWNEEAKVWKIGLSTGEIYAARYLVTALGLLSKANYPDIPGLGSFKGEMCHTAAWRPDIQLTGKRVGVIGCGSTGVQVITDIASRVGTLTCFQRHPQYSVPSGDKPVSQEYRKWVNENYDKIFHQVKNSIVGFGFVESTVPFHQHLPDQREKVFEDLWKQGNGFKFLLGGFSDLSTNKEANEAACQFIRKKISQIVTDAEKARKLTPHDWYARRPLCDGGYYEQFNRKNVDIVDLRETPIIAMTPEGIQTSDQVVHKLDLIIFATGFDAVEGNYNRIRITGRGGKTLKDHWEPQGPTAYLGVAVPEFPNLFMITGPQGPFTNLLPAIEAHVELVSRCIEQSEKNRRSGNPGVIEALPEAEKEWGRACNLAAEGNLFKETASWIFGSNVEGKKYALRFYFGGLAKFYQYANDITEDDFRGFKLTGNDRCNIATKDSPLGIRVTTTESSSIAE